MLNLDLAAAERFVSGHPTAFWDGWELVLWKKDDRGASSILGAFRNDAWGITTRVTPDEHGRYRFRA